MAIYISTLVIAGLLVMTGIVYIRLQQSHRQLDPYIADLIQRDYCARAMIDWGINSNADTGTYWPTKLDAISPSDDSADCPDCGFELRDASRLPLVDGDTVEARDPVYIIGRCWTKTGDHQIGYEAALQRAIHPALLHPIFADQYIDLDLDSDLRLSSDTLEKYPLATNGYFTKPTSAHGYAGNLIFGDNQHLLQRPFRVPEEPLDSELNYRVHIESFWHPTIPLPNHHLNFEPADSPPLIYRADRYIPYPDMARLKNIYLPEDASNPLNAIKLTGPATPVDLQPYIDDDNWSKRFKVIPDAYGGNRPVTVITRLALNGVFLLDAQGGAVLIRSSLIQGSLLIYNLGPAPEAGSPANKEGIYAPVTIDYDSIIIPHKERDQLNLASLAVPTVLPTLLIYGGDTDSADLDLLVNLSVDNLQIKSPVAILPDSSASQFNIDYKNMDLQRVPNDLEDIFPPDDGSFFTLPSTLEGLIMTERSHVKLSGGDTRIMPFRGILIAEAVDLQSVNVEYPENDDGSFPDYFEGDISLPIGLLTPHVTVVENSWRRIDGAELELPE
ncbi:MAG: hypothetical protein HJJLKODD_00574 [Phycisphaerae bacterium]|nr:hypothetical protein [Phycisphaerae bacterium]